MRGKHHRVLLRVFQNPILEAQALLGVQPGGGLVQHQQRGLAQQGLGHREALLHPAGVGADFAPRGRTQTGPGQQFVGPRGRFLQAGEQGHVVQELPARELGVQGVFLRHIADLPPHLQGRAGGVEAQDPHPPRGGRQQRGEQAQEGGLARAVGPQ